MSNKRTIPSKVTATVSPSLALLKYWGKLKGGINIPATSSIALTLSGLETRTELSVNNESDRDSFVLNDSPAEDSKVTSFLDHVRKQYALNTYFKIRSWNNFPTSAGLASSSSGFGALTTALSAFVGSTMDSKELSSMARIGSGSACRTVYGGFTHWVRGTEYAVPLYDQNYWSDLRVILILVSKKAKPTGSRSAMNHCSETSPVFPIWTSTNHEHEKTMLEALENKDLERVGQAMQASYLMMFSSMFTARPPVIYWLPESMAVIHACEKLRSKGFSVWETMDAGPQVKLFCLEKDLNAIVKELLNITGPLEYRISSPGAAPQFEVSFD
jgi:diphosphomevalonate decarboxylase